MNLSLTGARVARQKFGTNITQCYK